MLRKVLLVLAVAAIGVMVCQTAADRGFAQERGDKKKDDGDKKKKEGDKKKKAKPPYVHAVIFQLKKDTPKDAVEDMIADCHKMLKKIPAVRDVWAGRPAEKASKIAATDYQVGLLVLFENYEGLQEYTDHKLHLEFVEKHRKHFERPPLVYDFINQKK